MGSMAFKEAAAVFAALAERADRPAELLSASAQLEWLELVETLGRILPALQHDRINHLAEHGSPEELGGTLRAVLADRLRITPTPPRPGRGPPGGWGAPLRAVRPDRRPTPRPGAPRRIAEAADLAPRRA